MLGGIGGRRRRGRQRMRWLDGITDLMNMIWVNSRVGNGQGGLACCDSWGCKESDMTEWLNWTELNWTELNSESHSVISKADVFLVFSYFFDDPVGVSNLISGPSAFSKCSLNIWKFTIHVLLKPDLENFEHYFASVWNECNCVVVWTFFGISFLWDWNGNWPFPVLWPLKELISV